MNTLVIYNSKTGFTQKYAQWLAEELPCDLLSFEKAKKSDLAAYSTIIFASWFHAGKTKDIDWYKNLPLKQHPKIVLTTGSMPPEAPETKTALENNFKESPEKYKVFYLPSGLCYEKMGLPDRLMMKAFCKMLKKQQGENSEIYQTISHSYDISSKTYLEPVITYLRAR